MIGWRLCRRPFADLRGEGARRLGGRWNSPGRPVVYLAEHPALAVLEVRVHLDLPLDLLPSDFALIRVQVPDGPTIDQAPVDGTIAVGNAWLTRAPGATLRVPSILVPQSWNILFNPLHADAQRAEVQAIEDFRFDPRLWHPLAGEN